MEHANKQKCSDYFELTKPRIMGLILIITAFGYYLGAQGVVEPFTFFYLLLGTALTCAGSAVLNNYLEREYDSKMMRTRNRSIPSGRVLPGDALQFGISLTLIGLFVLYVGTNRLVAFLSLLTSFLYIMVYTPMKRVSWLNTTIGAVPGAIPTLGGWAAATGGLEFRAGILFLILFLWQHPHFYAIAWMCKDDYNRGGFKMLPCVEPDGKRTFLHTVIFSICLIPVSLTPSLIGMSGMLYFYGALILGGGLLIASIHLARTHSAGDARNLLKATVFYLPLLLILIICDATF